MQHDELSNLLRAADVAPPAYGEDFAAAVVRRRRRRRATRLAAGSTALLLAASLATALIFTRTDRSRSQLAAEHVPPPEPLTLAFAQESSIHELTLEKLAAMRRIRQRVTDADARASRPDARLAMARQREQAAMTLLQQAMRMSSDSARSIQADASFRLVIDLFPDTTAADVARRRMQKSQLHLKSS